MFELLDEVVLDGPHEVISTVRPQRVAFPIDTSRPQAAVEAAAILCQAWGGAGAALVPVDHLGSVEPSFRRMLRGDAVDYVLGNGAGEHNLTKEVVTLPDADGLRYSQLQFAPALLKYKQQSEFKPLQVVELEPSDPWQGIYAACLGTWPQDPSPHLLAGGRLIPTLRFEDFLTVERVQTAGSFADLVTRVEDSERLTPKQLAMYKLPNRNPHSWGFAAGDQLLPRRFHSREKAGPLVLVVCSDGDVRDLALLWNLRSKFGDFDVLPIGAPVAAVEEAMLRRLAEIGRRRKHAAQGQAVYLASASLTRSELECLRDGAGGKLAPDALGVVSAEEILHLGAPAGWDRRDVVSWQGGKAEIPMLAAEEMRNIMSHDAFGESTALTVDLEVPDQPFPRLAEGHVGGFNANFVAGSHTKWGAGRSDGAAREVQWPSRLLMARAAARRLELDLRESGPGLASRLLIEGLGGLGWVAYLLHEPLLRLLQDMGAREGMSWQRRRNRERGLDPIQSRDAVAPSADQLTEVHSDRFREALGRNTEATVAWLDWAERAGLVVKGVRVLCRYCRAEQWLPISGFTPPLTCRGCARTIDQPFAHHASTQFWYRISERLRRVYEHDAMSHILASYWFAMAFHGGGPESLLGIHPGLELVDRQSKSVLGEVDVLLMADDGTLIPIEVKSSIAGITSSELDKLAAVAARLEAPWTGTVIETYGIHGEFDPRAFEHCRLADQRYGHVSLTFDHILDQRPLLAIGDNPFGHEPLSGEAIREREDGFVQSLVQDGSLGTFNWLEYELLRPEPEA